MKRPKEKTISTIDETLQKEILDVIKTIAQGIKDPTPFQFATYNGQRKTIGDVFNGNYNKDQITLRLVVIDSLYSTNARYSYFSIDEIAEEIWKLGNTEKCAQDYFYSLATEFKDEKGLFSKHYGNRKNLAKGSMMKSLLSKYAYYSLLKDKANYPLGFPIYDRLAKSSFRTVCKKLGLKISMPDDPSIVDYVSKMNDLRKVLLGNDALFDGLQQFDVLDAYLWRMGKFEDGNLSLLIGKDDYNKFVTNLNLKSVSLNGFDEKVVEGCANVEKPFKGLSNEEYLNKLLEHWRHIRNA